MWERRSVRNIWYFVRMDWDGTIPLGLRDGNTKMDHLYNHLGSYKLRHDFSPHN
jgi:hypothetical protein